ncbi:MAG TPA: hypothetical protein VGO62_16380 [Myxococcota bacterium]|jgi:hypothetical protein
MTTTTPATTHAPGSTRGKRVDLAPLAWHEGLDAAVREATRRNVPIVSLRLLGRLDDELSCANSRFFRETLYVDARVQRSLAGFVLHWRSVRPVPVVTIDFGDGRILTRTLTGNSAHLILDARGRPVDALPGLYTRDGFLAALSRAREIASSTAALEGPARTRALASFHASALTAARSPPIASPQQPSANPFAARAAGAIAQTKMMVERPLLDHIDGLTSTIARDESFNEGTLHPRIHARFVAGVLDDEAALTSWIYRELFLMPDDDPWLGLVDSPIAAWAGLAP